MKYIWNTKSESLSAAVSNYHLIQAHREVPNKIDASLHKNVPQRGI